jgi:acetolactate synthase regulatory subunit
MQWLIALDTNGDPITSCRLMNIFRRKGVSIVTLAMAARPEGFSVVALAETPESEVEHVFNFLRRVEGTNPWATPLLSSSMPTPTPRALRASCRRSRNRS